MNDPGDSHRGDDERVAQIRRTVGAAIAKKREQAGMSQEAVAEMLGIGHLSISRMERGVHNVTAERLILLAEIFACRADELLLPGSDRLVDQLGELSKIMEEFTDGERFFVMEFARNFANYKKHQK